MATPNLDYANAAAVEAALDKAGSALQLADLSAMAAEWTDGLQNKALSFDITDTSSADDSLLLDLRVGGTPVFTVAKNGYLGINKATPESPIDVLSNKVIGGDTYYFADKVTSNISAGAANASTRTHHVVTNASGVNDMFTVAGGYYMVNNDKTSGTINHLIGSAFRAYNKSTGGVNSLWSVYADAELSGNSSVATMTGIHMHGLTVTNGTVGDAIGINVQGMTGYDTSGGTVTNAYGQKITMPTGAVNSNIGLVIGSAPASGDYGFHCAGDGRLVGTLRVVGDYICTGATEAKGNANIDGAATFNGDIILNNTEKEVRTKSKFMFLSKASSWLNWFTINSAGAENVMDCENLGSITAAGAITLSGLPTADPVAAGQLWNDAGTVKISAG